jgi:mannose-6-phosphate isomerase-like protein (cupin superfamily)
MTASPWSFPIDDALEAAARSERRFGGVLRRGTLLLGLYAPRGSDPQGPHTRDEVYVVVSGTGEFVRGNETLSFGPGDALFVPAGVEHRFATFGDDFAAWVVFYGPEGGEGGD